MATQLLTNYSIDARLCSYVRLHFALPLCTIFLVMMEVKMKGHRPSKDASAVVERLLKYSVIHNVINKSVAEE